MVNLPLGLFIGILAGAMFSIGTVLQKKAAAVLPKIESQTGKQNIKNFLSNKTWLMGVILTTAQWYIALLAIPLLPLSLFSSLMGVNLAILVVLSYFYLKEPVKRMELIGIAAIITGVVVLGLTAQKRAGKITFTEMIAYFNKPRAVFYTLLLIVSVVVAIVYSRTKGYAHGDIAFGLAAGFLLAIGQIYSKAFMSGFNEGQSLFIAATTFMWWIFILLLAIGNMGNMVTMQFGLQKGKAVVVATLAQVTGLVGGVLGGVIIFNEWGGLVPEIVGLKIGAVTAILAGVMILSRRTGQLKACGAPSNPI
ncbi:MAG: DMT family transporter [Candidatus Aminicenantes bacterium]|nr:DMT family transporter [Candidatus Aminicenantes bacterium]